MLAFEPAPLKKVVKREVLGRPGNGSRVHLSLECGQIFAPKFRSETRLSHGVWMLSAGAGSSDRGFLPINEIASECLTSKF